MYRDLFENANDAMLVVDPVGDHVKAANRRARELFGLDRDDLPEKRFADLTGEGKPSKQIFTALLTGPNDNFHMDLAVLDGAGRSLEAEVSASSTDIEGRVHLILSLRLQTVRQEAYLLMREMQSLANIGGWSVLLPERKLSWTNQVYHIHGIPPGTPISLEQAVNFHHAESRPLIQEALQNGMDEARSWDLELKLVTTRGHEVWVRSIGQAQVVDEKVVRLWGTYQDITERVLSERKLRQSQERYRAIVEDQPEFVCRFLPDGRLTFVNQAYCRYLEKHAHQLLGRDFREMIPESDRNEINRHLAGFDIENPVRTHEHRMIAPNGRMRWTRWTNRAVFDDQNTVVEMQGCGSDITDIKQAEEERRRLEDQLRQSQKMEAVGQLAGGIAHDFNNLLFVIGGYAEMALMDVDDPIACQQIEEIQKAAQRASNLTSQLLAFSRRQVLQPKDVNLNELIENLLDMIRRLIGEHIEVVWQPDFELASIHADHANMEQIIVNLAVNARDTMTVGGTLSIETHNVKADKEFVKRNPWARVGPYVHLAVSDSGEGIPAEIRERIFEPFFTTKEVGKGTGLGLSMVHGIVVQHGGHIEAASNMGEGTTFNIYLPAVGKRTLLQAIESVVDAPVGHETILLAEDEAMVRGLTAKILEKAGYKVIPARDGEDALTIFNERGSEVDLVLLDVIMPKKSGPIVMEEIARGCPEMRFLFMSGYSADEVHSSHLLQHGVPLLQKPYASAELLQTVRMLLDNPSRRLMYEEDED
ncbi:MAG: PAS domain S-box protein [Acidobacteriota bacterium]|nr:PAS domain S-box protein [Acidobacteriota bacterium]